MGASDQSVASTLVPPAFAGGGYSAGAGKAGSIPGNGGVDKVPDPITAEAQKISAGATEDERAMAEAIYGEAGGNLYDDKIAVGWTMLPRKDNHPDMSYHDIANKWYKPKDSLRKVNVKELQAWKDSFQAARHVLSANPTANPIEGATHFYSPKKGEKPPYWVKGATRVPYGSGAFLFYKAVK